MTKESGWLKIVGGAALAWLVLATNSGVQGATTVSGDSAGTFVNPSGPAGMVVTGVGTSFFTWGQAYPDVSSLSYANVPFNSPTETPFKIGTLSYYNGTIAGGTEANTVDLSLAVSFTDPSGVNQTFLYGMQLINIANTSDPIASADYLILSTFPNATFTVDSTVYTLKLAFDNLQGGGFLQTGNQLHVLEQNTATADLMGIVTTDISGVVPEPSTCIAGALLLLPFGAGLLRKIRK